MESDCLKISHNGMFDWLRLQKAGVRLKGPLWCTMIAQQVVDSDAPAYDLESVASYWLDMARWKHKGAPKYKPRQIKKRDWKRPFSCATCGGQALSGTGKQTTRICEGCTDMAFRSRLRQYELDAIGYNRMDAQVLIPIQAEQEHSLRKNGQIELFRGMMLVLEDVLLPLQARGLKIDIKTRESSQILYSRRASEASTTWKHITDNVNPSSVPQLKNLLYDRWNLPVQYDNDRPTTNNEALLALKEIASGRPKKALTALATYRTSKKWHTTYTKIGDRIYPAYGPATKDRSEGGKRYGAIAATGRIIAKGDLSTKTPPLQQVPKELRHLIVPEKGNRFIGADYKSQELKLITAHTKCVYLAEKGSGLFDALSTRYGCPRVNAKNLFYGLWAYGGSARAGQRALRQKGINISIGECEAFIRDGHHRVPEIFAWHNHVLEMATRDGSLRNSFGRIRRFKDLSKQRNEALNYLIQSDAADMQWHILRPIELQLRKLGGFTSILLHDGFTWEVPQGMVEKAKVVIKGGMERPFDNIAKGFSCGVELMVGTNWKEVS